ncbi:MAG TPA: spermidine synthase, partial [bacterium]|nr:spermidine synthase [bacterium]
MNAFLLILFFLSGFASLVYEVLWTRLFGLLLGNTTLAISCVLAAFFTGLALGGRYFGRRADLNPHPLRLFAGMEMAILLSGLVILLLRGPIEALFTWAHPWLVPHPLLYYLIRFVIAFMVMLPATFFMGGTLPVMSRAFIQSRQGGAGQLGRLYGINTLGGMAGCLATAFFFLRSFGFTAAYAAAIGIDIFIAGSAWLFARSSGESAINAPGRSRI